MKGTVIANTTEGFKIEGADGKIYYAKGVNLKLDSTVEFDPSEDEKALNVKECFSEVKGTATAEKFVCPSSQVETPQTKVEEDLPLCEFPPIDPDTLSQAVRKWILKVEADFFEKSLWYAEDFKKSKIYKEKKADYDTVPNRFYGELGWAPTDYFSKVKSQMCFALEIGKQPSLALDAFFSHEGKPTICECHSLLIAVYYRAILEVTSPDLFNECFSDMYIASMLGWAVCPLKPLFSGIGETDYQIGDWAVFNNHPDYKKRHPAGAAMGWNIICVALNPIKWIGFGLGREPVTTAELSKMMYDYYIERPSADEESRVDKEFKEFSGQQILRIKEEFEQGFVQVKERRYEIGIPKSKTKRLSAKKLNEYLAKKHKCKFADL